MREFDIDAFEERAAIAEFDGGQSRFQAETMAAQAQDVTRWQALQIIRGTKDANGSGHSQGCRDTGPAMAGRQRSQCMSTMQPISEKEEGSLPEHYAQTGRDSVELLALSVLGRGVL